MNRCATDCGCQGTEGIEALSLVLTSYQALDKAGISNHASAHKLSLMSVSSESSMATDKVQDKSSSSQE